MSERERVVWGALGVVSAVIAVRILGPMACEFFDARCATWRYVAMLLGGAVLLGVLSHYSGSEVAGRFANNVIPMMLVIAGLVALFGMGYVQIKHELLYLERVRL
jgi:hypothetical protein